MRTIFAVLLFSGTAAFAAEEPSGCDKFKWPIDRERAALTSTARTQAGNGRTIKSLPANGMTFELKPIAEAKLPSSPERAPKDGTFAGFVRFDSPAKAGVYTVSLSAGAWVDVTQDGHFLKPKAFSGATDCDGIRKTMKYELSANPITLQISGAREPAFSIVVLPSE